MEKDLGTMARQRDMVMLSMNPTNLILWSKFILETFFLWVAHTQNVYKLRNKRSVGDLKESKLNRRKVFVKVDFDIPLALDDSFNIIDDTKICTTVPTIKFLMVHSARVIICNHMGCLEGVSFEYSLKPLVPRLSQLLGVEVKMANDCIGKEPEEMVVQLSNRVSCYLKM
ncbi:hypothetical protein SLEP1_g38102 [Rubroshorea leprosula]|uniref:Phosphoglycerate kinase n=1 Tax=Rubroshorea leprosula TaxID=152421 RepID=A0AAV5KX37_9ROSI|nr:hypothetical protein SLEP1_g38102 [Rubroshorea leprosula]